MHKMYSKTFLNESAQDQMGDSNYLFLKDLNFSMDACSIGG